MCKSKSVAGITKSPDLESVFLGEIASDAEPNSLWNVELNMDGVETLFKIDTGSDVIEISEKEFYKNHKGNQLKKTSRNLLGPGNQRLHVKGQFTAKVSTSERETTQEVFVIAGMTQNLLGRPAIEELQVVQRIQELKNGSTAYQARFLKLFTGLGKIEGEYKIELEEDSKPFAIHTPRRVPLPLMDKVKKELQRMQDLGVIVPIEELTNRLLCRYGGRIKT